MQRGPAVKKGRQSWPPDRGSAECLLEQRCRRPERISETGDPKTFLQIPAVFRAELVSSLGQDRDEAVYGFLGDGQCSGVIRHATLTP
jgi:hypothetical protein